MLPITTSLEPPGNFVGKINLRRKFIEQLFIGTALLPFLNIGCTAPANKEKDTFEKQKGYVVDDFDTIDVDYNGDLIFDDSHGGSASKVLNNGTNAINAIPFKIPFDRDSTSIDRHNRIKDLYNEIVVNKNNIDFILMSVDTDVLRFADYKDLNFAEHSGGKVYINNLEDLKNNKEVMVSFFKNISNPVYDAPPPLQQTFKRYAEEIDMLNAIANEVPVYYAAYNFTDGFQPGMLVDNPNFHIVQGADHFEGQNPLSTDSVESFHIAVKIDNNKNVSFADYSTTYAFNHPAVAKLKQSAKSVREFFKNKSPEEAVATETEIKRVFDNMIKNKLTEEDVRVMYTKLFDIDTLRTIYIEHLNSDPFTEQSVKTFKHWGNLVPWLWDPKTGKPREFSPTVAFKNDKGTLKQAAIEKFNPASDYVFCGNSYAAPLLARSNSIKAAEASKK